MGILDYNCGSPSTTPWHCRAVAISDAIKLGEDFELDPRTYELRRSGRVLKLERIPVEILILLVDHRGQVVSRKQMVDRVWGAGTFLDTDNSINGAIRKIRQVLKDDPEQPRFVQTITGRGYRFIAPLVEADAEKQRTPSERLLEDARVATRPSNVSPALKQAVRRRRQTFLGMGVLLIVAVGAYFLASRSRVRSQPSAGRSMLAVLPFENLTGDASQDYFSDGLTEEMIGQLGRVDPQHLGVIARTSVMHYKHTQEQSDQIGRELGVQYVIEGSVRRDADKVRVTAQLIQTKDQTRIWSHQYDRELTSLLLLQGEIAQEIADEIQVTLGEGRPGHAAPHATTLAPNSYEAYDLYLKGRYFLNKRTDRGFQRAVECFEQSVAKDPDYAHAYAGLADSYALMSAYDVAPSSELIPKARAAALKALELDEKLAEAHAALALIAQNYDWDWQTAEKEYSRALALDPNYATGHHWYAEHLALLGRFDEAFPEMKRALQLDPLSLIIQTDNGVILYFSRQYDAAIKQLRAVLEMEPNFPRAHMLAYAYVQEGQFADALADVENWRRVDNTYRIEPVEAYVYGRAGQDTQAQHDVEKLELLNRRRQIDPFFFIGPYIGLGDKNQAFAWLDKSVAARSPSLTALKVDPTYDPLRSDPRFRAILQRVGLAQ